jgi:NADH-quinone oxidoreductase E subunit
VARSAMLPCLHLAQEAEGRITVDGILAVAEVLGVKPDEVESVVTFYSMYHTEPVGQYVIKVCTSISCYLRGCDDLMHHLEQRLGIHHGETTPDGQFTLGHIECLAACGMAPVLQVNGEFVERVTPERADLLVERLQRDAGLGDLASHWHQNAAGGFTAADDGDAGHTGASGSNGATATRADTGAKETR